MRCKKCGFISFDWLSACKKCGKSLSEEKLLLGISFSDNSDINWFTLYTETAREEVQKEEPNTAELHETETKPVDLSEIDVSDLVAEDISDEELEIEIGEEDLQHIAQNENLQKALEEISE